MQPKEQFQNAFQFFASYFHQDFGAEFGEPELAVGEFIQGANLQTRAAVVAELKQICDGTTEEELDKMVFELGCYYSPQRHRGWTMNQWVHDVIAQLEKSLV